MHLCGSRHIIAILLFSCIILIISSSFITPNQNQQKIHEIPVQIPRMPPKHVFNITRAHIISMTPENDPVIQELVRGIRFFLHISNTTVFPAINGTQAVKDGAYEYLSFYTKYLMLTGRHDHMQLSTPGMLGCLLSHMQLWQSVLPNETVAIFEEDAYVDLLSAERMHVLSVDVERLGLGWDVFLLESGHNLIASGEWISLGELAANCSYQPSSNKVCTWFGTRGYLITYQGAQHLLRYVYPISVQVDSLMGLVASFSPGFKLLWTRKDIAHLRLFHVTGVWDACFKCYLPASPYPYVLMIIMMLLTCCGSLIQMRGRMNEFCTDITSHISRGIRIFNIYCKYTAHSQSK